MSLKSNVPHEIINHVIRFFRSLKLLWCIDRQTIPIPLSSRCFFTVTLSQKTISDCVTGLSNELDKTPHGKYLLSQLKRGSVVLPYMNPDVPIFQFDYKTGEWGRGTLNLFVTADEYASTVVSPASIDTITKVITTIYCCASIRENRRLYIVQRNTEKVISSRLIDVRACGQIYVQSNAMITNLSNVDVPTIVVTVHQLQPEDGVATLKDVVYVSVILPHDAHTILCTATDVGSVPVASMFPPLIFGCTKKHIIYIDTEASPIASLVIKGRKWWPAVIFAQYISSTRKRSIDTLLRSIKKWEIVHSIPYTTFRLYMWYVYYTVQSSVIIDIREYLKARAIENKLKYIKPSDYIIGLTSSPFFIDKPIQFHTGKESVKAITSTTQYSFVTPSLIDIGIRQISA